MTYKWCLWSGGNKVSQGYRGKASRDQDRSGEGECNGPVVSPGILSAQSIQGGTGHTQEKMSVQGRQWRWRQARPRQKGRLNCRHIKGSDTSKIWQGLVCINTPCQSFQTKNFHWRQNVWPLFWFLIDKQRLAERDGVVLRMVLKLSIGNGFPHLDLHPSTS